MWIFCDKYQCHYDRVIFGGMESLWNGHLGNTGCMIESICSISVTTHLQLPASFEIHSVPNPVYFSYRYVIKMTFGFTQNHNWTALACRPGFVVFLLHCLYLEKRNKMTKNVLLCNGIQTWPFDPKCYLDMHMPQNHTHKHNHVHKHNHINEHKYEKRGVVLFPWINKW